jgi:glutathione S-transferase
MMQIWGRMNSTNVRKVLWCAEEIGLSYERVDAGGQFGVVDQPDYRAKNPNGLVPCLVDGDFVLWESNVIVRYLARQYGAAAFPAVADAREWAEAEKWMDWTSLSITGPFRDVFWNLVRRSPEQRNEDEVARGIMECGRLLAVADAALGRQPYLSGEAFGIGDIPLGCIAYAWFSMPIERPDLPNLARWYESLRARPAYQKGVMTPLT